MHELLTLVSIASSHISTEIHTSKIDIMMFHPISAHVSKKWGRFAT